MTMSASAFWPFYSSDDEEGPRLSELMEPATELIDEASDLAAEGKVDEAVTKYRAALKELDKVERENPKRAKKPEMATLRTKRAYVSAAIDSLLLNQARANARPVAVSNTAELEKKLAAEKQMKAGGGEDEKSKVKAKEKAKTKEKDGEKTKEKVKDKEPSKEKDKAKDKDEKDSEDEKETPKVDFEPKTPREEVMAAIMTHKYAEARERVREMLSLNPGDAVALNLKAAIEAEAGDLKAAERSLDKAIDTNPRDYCAYYNMAELMLKRNNVTAAKRYYETGRALNGPKDEDLESRLK